MSHRAEDETDQEEDEILSANVKREGKREREKK